MKIFEVELNASETKFMHLRRTQLHFERSKHKICIWFLKMTLLLIQMKKYAEMYGVHDVVNWVKSNCSFAKMYLPKASCEEINILVASCYKDDKKH